jgi:transcriptional regulator with XRE-family HTH domain
MKLSEQLRRARTRRGWSQVQTASAAGVAQTTVSKAERGGFDDRPDAEEVRAILGALDGQGKAAEAPEPEPLESQGADDSTAVEEALSRAFAPGFHMPRDASAVERETRELAHAFGDLATPQAKERLTACARVWLDVAAELRIAGRPVTARSLLFGVTLRALESSR